MRNKTLRELSEKLKSISRDPLPRYTLQNIGNESADMIRIRTTQGFGVKYNGAEKYVLEKLKPSTIKARKRNKSNLASGAGPVKSRLTETGEMLESITAQIKGNFLNIFLKGRRNQKLASYHEEGYAPNNLPKRPFFHFSGKEIEKITQLYQEALIKVLKNKFRRL